MVTHVSLTFEGSLSKAFRLAIKLVFGPPRGHLASLTFGSSSFRIKERYTTRRKGGKSSEVRFTTEESLRFKYLPRKARKGVREVLRSLGLDQDSDTRTPHIELFRTRV